MKIGRRKIGSGAPVFIIAELSANHGQNLNIAFKSIKAMRDAGADAVKLQTYTADTITLNSRRKYFRIKQGTIWDGKYLYELYSEASTPWDWQPKLKKYAEKLGLECFSSPFDKSAVDFLEKMKVPAYKIASFEITDIPLIEYAASKGKPMLISTGIARPGEIRDAVSACKRKGNNKIVLLKCTSEYPARPEDLNLLTIPDIRKRYGTLVGLSDHSMSPWPPSAAAALGAAVIEKHFIIDRKIGGPDAAFSLEPSEFRNMVNGVRETEKALGKATYRLTPSMESSREFRRSLFVVGDIAKGGRFSAENVRSIRPGYGMMPKFLKTLIGKKAKTAVKAGTPMKARFIHP